jgi:major vault protein
VPSVVVKSNQALLIKAVRKTHDSNNVLRLAGEKWLIRKVGSYLPGVNEQIVKVIDGTVLTDKLCI